VTTPAGAVLPLRLFLGVTFLYAGLDKLLDPSFLDSTSLAWIGAQLAAFARSSPLADLLRAAIPLATPIGALIAVAEIGIGLGALSGIAFQAAAIGGAGLSLLFWLTASWSTHPYYYGPDLPYAAGWITIALAGHGGLLVPRIVRETTERPTSPGRRALIQAGVLAGASLAIAAVALPYGLARRHPVNLGEDGGPLASPATSPTVDPSVVPSSSPSVGPTPTGSGPADLTIARVADVAAAGAFAFTVPFAAPAPLPAGDPGIVVKLASGKFVAFDAVCTHAGCTVEWDPIDAILACPCHGALFDPAHGARVLGGPTNQPLAALPLTIDPATGTIRLKA